MKIFLSWSGPRSKAAAESLGAWLKQVIQAVDPWISTDIDKGARWQIEIANHLEDAKVGIVCLTRENLNAPWILFESGALAKMKSAYVCTFLLGVNPADVEQPLGQFQATEAKQEDVRHLVQTVNEQLGKVGERSLDDDTLGKVFAKFWPDLKESLTAILAQKPSEAEKPHRSERELLEELLALVRQQSEAQAKTSLRLSSLIRQSIALSRLSSPPSNSREIYDQLLKQYQKPEVGQAESGESLSSSEPESSEEPSS